MAGIYIHIPFCKQACHYCDFHFSTSLKLKEPLLIALKKEIVSRMVEIQGEKISTIYFGGGTPSILTTDEIKSVLEAITSNYHVLPNAEITLEANPDDLSSGKIKELKSSSVNRLSIGVQSFFDDDLKYMNRVHNSVQAEAAIKASQDSGFENLTVDLIYGTPGLTLENWAFNMRKLVSLQISHISCYSLTVEKNTPLDSLIKRKKEKGPDEEKSADHFMEMVRLLPANGYEHYEISNFAQDGYRSQHNTSYWRGVPYLGFGPGAHSFNGSDTRRWNISNNALYINKVNDGSPYYEMEKLTLNDRINEYIMTQLRLIEGLSIPFVAQQFGTGFSKQLHAQVNAWDPSLYRIENDCILLSSYGKLLSDKLASSLFFVD